MVCTECPAGSFCESGAGSPTSCDSGYYALSGSTSCTECPAGSYCPDTTAAVTCADGSYSLGGTTTCTNCPLGKIWMRHADYQACGRSVFRTGDSKCTGSIRVQGSSSSVVLVVVVGSCSSWAVVCRYAWYYLYTYLQTYILILHVYYSSFILLISHFNIEVAK